jgi:MoxR-like ATPase
VDNTRDSGTVAAAGELCARVRAEMAKRIVGKDELVSGMLTGVIAGGHVLLEGVPGLAKTLAAKTFAEIAGLSFSRVQFTPDLLPADITGSLVYEQATGRFVRGAARCSPTCCSRTR